MDRRPLGGDHPANGLSPTPTPSWYLVSDIRRSRTVTGAVVVAAVATAAQEIARQGHPGGFFRKQMQGISALRQQRIRAATKAARTTQIDKYRIRASHRSKRSGSKAQPCRDGELRLRCRQRRRRDQVGSELRVTWRLPERRFQRFDTSGAMFASRFLEGRFRKCVITVTISARIGQAHYHMAGALVSAVNPLM